MTALGPVGRQWAAHCKSWLSGSSGLQHFCVSTPTAHSPRPTWLWYCLMLGKCLLYSPCLSWGSKSAPPISSSLPLASRRHPLSRRGGEGSWNERTKGQIISSGVLEGEGKGKKNGAGTAAEVGLWRCAAGAAGRGITWHLGPGGSQGLGTGLGRAQGGRKDFPATVCLQTQGKHGLTRWPLLRPHGPKSWGGDQAALACSRS